MTEQKPTGHLREAPRLAGNVTSSTVEDGVIHKVSHGGFTPDRADRWIQDAGAYAEALTREGYAIPETYEYTTEPREDGSVAVVQRARFVQGHALNDQRLPLEQRQGEFGQVMAMINDAGVDKDGLLVTPPDAKPDNFVLGDDGKLYLVDTLPPMVRAEGSDFPYENLVIPEGPLRKDWIDRYVRSRKGVMTRAAALAIKGEEGLRGLLSPRSLEEDIASLLSSVDRRSQDRLAQDIKGGIRPYLARTAMRKVAERYIH